MSIESSVAMNEYNQNGPGWRVMVRRDQEEDSSDSDDKEIFVPEQLDETDFASDEPAEVESYRSRLTVDLTQSFDTFVIRTKRKRSVSAPPRCDHSNKLPRKSP
jgi:hypothetical protein